MASSSSSTPTNFSFLLSASLVTLLLVLFSSSDKSYALRDINEAVTATTPKRHHHQYYHTVEISSLLPSSICSRPPTKGQRRGRRRRSASSLEVVHRHGACSQASSEAAPTMTELLARDQSRVNSIHSRLRRPNHSDLQEDSTTLPARSDTYGNYMVTVGLGTPKKDLSLLFDTGSNLTWTQCQPCLTSCYKQNETIFDPSLSTSYKNVGCDSTQCSSSVSGTGNLPGCAAGSKCIYEVQYADQSFSTGYLSSETLTLQGGSGVWNNFVFGCGQNNQGSFVGVAGILGLGPDPISIVSQTSLRFGKYFSYCLPSTPSSTGHLTFGKEEGTNSATMLWTPLSIKSYYFVDLIAISVGGETLPISNSVFATTGGTVIDSRCVITRLPPAAYTALRSGFRQRMTKYPLVAEGALDTCYNVSGYSTVELPTISFTFGGGVDVQIPAAGIAIPVSSEIICLAFVGNSDDYQVGIFGSTQLKTLEVAYDVAGGKLGFASGGCS